MECPICLTKYDGNLESLIPRILTKCGHTMCHGCVEKQRIVNEILCPFDRKITSLKGGVESLNKNFAVLDVIGQVSDVYPALIEVFEDSENGETLKTPEEPSEPSQEPGLPDSSDSVDSSAELSIFPDHNVSSIQNLDSSPETSLRSSVLEYNVVQNFDSSTDSEENYDVAYDAAHIPTFHITFMQRTKYALKDMATSFLDKFF
ncbi:unnamed protein product [Caenorhabditis nigoni]